MDFDLHKSLDVLERTPRVLYDLLDGIPDEWAMNNEGGATWSPYDILGHLIHGEQTDWMERLNIIMKDDGNKAFNPFDRFAQFEESKGKSLSALLKEFEGLRKVNLILLRAFTFTESDYSKTGIHPEFGEVTLSHLLATWVVHDLTHIAQVARVMAKQYDAAVGPWKKYFRLLQE